MSKKYLVLKDMVYFYKNSDRQNIQMFIKKGDTISGLLPFEAIDLIKKGYIKEIKEENKCSL